MLHHNRERRGVSNVAASFMLTLVILISLVSIDVLMGNFVNSMNVVNEQFGQLSYRVHERILANVTINTARVSGNQYNVTVKGFVVNVGSNDVIITNYIVFVMKVSSVESYSKSVYEVIPVNGARLVYLSFLTGNIAGANLYLVIVTQKGSTFFYGL